MAIGPDPPSEYPWLARSRPAGPNFRGTGVGRTPRKCSASYNLYFRRVRSRIRHTPPPCGVWRVWWCWRSAGDLRDRRSSLLWDRRMTRGLVVELSALSKARYAAAGVVGDFGSSRSITACGPPGEALSTRVCSMKAILYRGGVGETTEQGGPHHCRNGFLRLSKANSSDVPVFGCRGGSSVSSPSGRGSHSAV